MSINIINSFRASLVVVGDLFLKPGGSVYNNSVKQYVKEGRV